MISGSALKAEVTMNQIGNDETAASASAVANSTGRTRGLSASSATSIESELERGDGEDHREHDHGHRGRIAHAEVLEAVLQYQQSEHQGGICRAAGIRGHRVLQREGLKGVDRAQRRHQ